MTIDTGIAGMQLAQVVHGIVGVLFVAVMLAHIYIGTLGMEGAFEAMGTGKVDVELGQGAPQPVGRARSSQGPPPGNAAAAECNAGGVTPGLGANVKMAGKSRPSI